MKKRSNILEISKAEKVSKEGHLLFLTIIVKNDGPLVFNPIRESFNFDQNKYFLYSCKKG